ncbi:hypothetical protein HT654_09805, partial [Ursidibacter maritimus]|nr:hypothetical protein [Ursidibacter maritimus]
MLAQEVGDSSMARAWRAGMFPAAKLTAIDNTTVTSMRYMDFSSWQGAMTTIIGLAVFTLLG